MRDLGWILLCDDDETVLEREQELLENYWNETGRDPMPVRVFHRAADVLGENFTEEDSPTLAFLDVYLEDRFTGFDLVRYLRRTAPELLVVIVTGYREKLDEAMDTRVFRFMEKPLEQGYFCRIMDIAEERIRRIRGDFSFQTAGGTKILKRSIPERASSFVRGRFGFASPWQTACALRRHIAVIWSISAM